MVGSPAPFQKAQVGKASCSAAAKAPVTRVQTFVSFLSPLSFMVCVCACSSVCYVHMCMCVSVDEHIFGRWVCELQVCVLYVFVSAPHH